MVTKGRTRRVLIVDDMAEQRDIYAVLLRVHGYEVLEAEDGYAAIDVAERDRPDVVVMDIMLPGLDGWEAIERIRDLPGHETVPVIVLTARVVDEDRRRSVDRGATAFLAKPCDPRRVLAEIERLAGD